MILKKKARPPLGGPKMKRATPKYSMNRITRQRQHWSYKMAFTRMNPPSTWNSHLNNKDSIITLSKD
jgi:hypothetical protein